VEQRGGAHDGPIDVGGEQAVDVAQHPHHVHGRVVAPQRLPVAGEHVVEHRTVRAAEVVPAPAQGDLGRAHRAERTCECAGGVVG